MASDTTKKNPPSGGPTISGHFRRVSKSPTNPKQAEKSSQFDVATLFSGPFEAGTEEPHEEIPLDEKLRQAYFWIVNSAIISPHYDVEYNVGPAKTGG